MHPKPLRILVDGYNVLFQSQLVGSGRGAGWLERARGRMLKLLESGLSQQDLLQTEIVFDAAQHGPTPDDAVLPSGLVVTFSREHPEADDLIEERIRQHAHPKSLTVVSADNRIQRCAKARKAVVSTPESFLQELELVTTSKPVDSSERLGRFPAEIGKPPMMNENDVDFWIAEFNLDINDDDLES